MIKINDKIISKISPKNPFFERKIVHVNAIKQVGPYTVIKVKGIKGWYRIEDFIKI